ncbi:MAG: RpoL/Rpb11 RNA polymerase subunit family protein [Candidatus Aenigmatarchaeota archaeon]
MEVKVLEKDKNKLKIELDDLTLVNLLNEKLWERKVELSSYAVAHPYLSKPVLLVKSKDPKKSLINSSGKIVTYVRELRKEVEKAIK